MNKVIVLWLLGSLVHGGLKTFVQSKGKYLSCIKLFFTIAEHNFNINVCEMTHNLTKDDFGSEWYSIYMLFNNVSPIHVIELYQIVKIKEYKNGELVYGGLYLCWWCVIKCQNMNSNKTIHKCLYDFQHTLKEEYANENFVWVPLCTDVQRQTLCDDTFPGNRFFAMKILILIHWKKHMKKYLIILL